MVEFQIPNCVCLTVIMILIVSSHCVSGPSLTFRIITVFFIGPFSHNRAVVLIGLFWYILTVVVTGPIVVYLTVSYTVLISNRFVVGRRFISLVSTLLQFLIQFSTVEILAFPFSSSRPSNQVSSFSLGVFHRFIRWLGCEYGRWVLASSRLGFLPLSSRWWVSGLSFKIGAFAKSGISGPWMFSSFYFCVFAYNSVWLMEICNGCYLYLSLLLRFVCMRLTFTCPVKNPRFRFHPQIRLIFWIST